MMNSFVQWYLRKYFQGGNPWGMSNGWFPNQNASQSNSGQGTQNTWGAMGIPPWIGDMMNNMWGGNGNPGIGNPGIGNLGIGNSESGGGGSSNPNAGNNSSPFPSWIQDVIQQHGFPFANGNGNPGGIPGGNPGFFGSQQGFNPFAMFQSQSPNQTNQAAHSSAQRAARHQTQSYGQQQSRRQPQSHNQPRRFDPGKR